MRLRHLYFITLFSVITITNAAARELTPVEKHGALRVEGNKIVDKNGDPVQLRGMSFFWSQWMEQFYNKRAVDWLADDWKVTIVRAAMGVKHNETKTGYMFDGSEKKKVKTVVDAAIKKGIYVIIDWHDHHAYESSNTAAAQKFFEEMARTYGHYPNIIYEIFNEPERVSWSETVKPYSEKIVSAIRAVDPDNLIILGTPFWCQNVNEAADDPLDGHNLVYSLHFYAASHKGDIRDKAQYALDKGIPLFVSEWGTCLASGNGFLDSLETERWFTFMDEHKLSWCNWSIADKAETASALVPGARYYGGWKHDDLTRSGRIVRNKLRFYAGVKEEEPVVKKKKESKFKLKPVR
ncbi:MAG: glycoside hydrolase family 5 protein [Chitinispirillales bacterium]|jgi:endoglucanase|nr:glycoside hydrolase family 5 protein [Chitinispirillales bacterium]